MSLTSHNQPSWSRCLAVATALLVALPAFAQHYVRTDLTENRKGISSQAKNVDPNLVNAWGLSRSSGSPWWIADNGTGLSTLYDLAGKPQSLVVTIPAPNGTSGPSAPTGTVFNYTTSFQVTKGNPAVFLFVTEDGTIAGWNPNVNLTKAKIVVDRSKAASYKGLAIAQTSTGPRVYATNFKTGKIEVFDASLHQIFLHAGAFEDSRLPANFVPFNIQSVGGNLVVTFAHRLPGSEDEDHGAGLGYVTVFDTAGNVLLRLQHGSFLNAPWGVTAAPSDFGKFAHRILIGNFGDGTILAFNALSGKFEGKLLSQSGNNIVVPGLWALSFGNGATAGSSTDLYFTAGPHDENDGLFGKLTAVSNEQRGNSD